MFLVKHFSLGAVLQNVYKISKMYYGNRRILLCNKNHTYTRYYASNLLHICFSPFPEIERGGWYTKSLIEKLNKMNDVKAKYMYSLNFTVFFMVHV